MSYNINEIVDFFKNDKTGVYRNDYIRSLMEPDIRDYSVIIGILNELKKHGLICRYQTSPIEDRGIYFESETSNQDPEI